MHNFPSLNGFRNKGCVGVQSVCGLRAGALGLLFGHELPGICPLYHLNRSRDNARMIKPALICIDFQKGFDEPVWGERNNSQAENNIALLLSYWRKRALPVIHVKHCSLEKNSPLRADASGSEFKAEARPIVGEKMYCTDLPGCA